LEGAMETIRRCKPIIIVETLPSEDWLSQNLFPLGYRLAEPVYYNSVLRCD
jgi:hypothetical protein